jgi:hypothetical protein
LTPEIEAVARRCVWYKPPAAAIEAPEHFIAHVLTYGTHEDVAVLRRAVTDDELRAAMNNAPAGVFDGRSWSYWQLKLFDRYTAPPLPTRAERLAAPRTP